MGYPFNVGGAHLSLANAPASLRAITTIANQANVTAPEGSVSFAHTRAFEG
jgi:hypothetical protein